MDKITAIATVVVCLFGSGGIVLWFLNRVAKKHDARDTTAKDLKEIKEYRPEKHLSMMQNNIY